MYGLVLLASGALAQSEKNQSKRDVEWSPFCSYRFSDKVSE